MFKFSCFGEICLLMLLPFFGAANGDGDSREDSLRKNIFDMSLEELVDVDVVTSSRKPEKVDAAPNVIYVITADEIKQRGYRSYRDILQTIPGMNVFFGDFGYFSQVRGVAPNAHNKVTYMINGQEVNQLGESNHLNGPVSLDCAERVEIIVGPGSVLYGAETLLAIVNVITKSDGQSMASVRLGRDLIESSSALGYKNMNLAYSKKWTEKRHASFNLSVLEQDGWNPSDSLNLPTAIHFNSLDKNLYDKYNLSFFSTMSARFDEISFQATSYNAELVDVGRSQRANVEGVRVDRVDNIMFQHNKAFDNGFESRLQFNYVNKRMARMTTKGLAENDDLSQNQYRGEGILTYKKNMHYVQFGAVYILYQNQFNYNIYWVPNDPVYSKDTSYAMQFIEKLNYNAYGFYVSEEWQPFDKLKAVLAFRLDRNEILKENKWYASPRLAVVYKVSPRYVAKVMYNTSTHMPTPRQSQQNMLYGADKPEGVAPVWAMTNELVSSPEQLHAYEFQNIITLHKHRFVINAYYQDIQGFISWFNPATNMGDFYGYGIELDWKAKMSRTVSLWGNFAHSNTDFTLTAKKFNETRNFPSNEKGESVSVPRFTINGGVDLRLANNMSMSLIGKYFTRQPAYIIEEDESVAGGINRYWDYVDNQFYLDLNLSVTDVVVHDLDVNVRCMNVFDNTEYIAAQFRQYRYKPRGRSLVVGVAYNF